MPFTVAWSSSDFMLCPTASHFMSARVCINSTRFVTHASESLREASHSALEMSVCINPKTETFPLSVYRDGHNRCIIKYQTFEKMRVLPFSMRKSGGLAKHF